MYHRKTNQSKKQSTFLAINLISNATHDDYEFSKQKQRCIACNATHDDCEF